MTWYIDIYGKNQDVWQTRLELENYLKNQEFTQRSVCDFYHKELSLTLHLAFTNNPNAYNIDEKNPPNIINYISMICWEYGVIEKDYWQWVIDFAQQFNWKIQDNRLEEAIDTIGVFDDKQKIYFEVD